MVKSELFTLTNTESFPHLSRAPITEAVIEIRAQTSAQWEEHEVVSKLKPDLDTYSDYRPTRGFTHSFKMGVGVDPEAITQDLGWQGAQFTSIDKGYIAKFQSDLFLLSRLTPYEDWDRFKGEAMRLWDIHKRLALPTSIQRLGLRYINAIPMEPGMQSLQDYFTVFPKEPFDLDVQISGFLHRTVYSIAGSPYIIILIKTIQPPNPATKTGPTIILDIDVSTVEFFDPINELIDQKLHDMRRLKNKVFFSVIQTKIIDKLK